MDGRELRCTNGLTGANPVRKSDVPRAESRVWWVPILAPDTFSVPLFVGSPTGSKH